MNPSKNDFLAKDEDDEGDTCHQTCTSIGHRVCNPSLILGKRPCFSTGPCEVDIGHHLAIHALGELSISKITNINVPQRQ